MVAALRRAGAVVMGKTDVAQTPGLHETDNAIWDRTGNPRDLSRTSGGSSGGEALSLRRAARRLDWEPISVAVYAPRRRGVVSMA